MTVSCKAICLVNDQRSCDLLANMNPLTNRRMKRLTFAFLCFAMTGVPALIGCSGSNENTVVTGNDQAQAEAEEAEAENDEQPGDTPDAGSTDQP